MPRTPPTSASAAATLIAFALTLVVPSAAAAVRGTVPDEEPYAPIYARSLHVENPASAWVPIVIYRDPDCIPPDYDLVALFDRPRAWSCPLLVHGLVVQDPEVPNPPRQVILDAEELPIWFVTRTDWEAAGGTADFTGAVTWAEVQAMPSLLRGRATYHEVLHPIPGPRGGGAQVVTDHYQARGLLEAGRRFTMLVTGQNRPAPGEAHTVESYRLHVWRLDFG